MRHFARAKTLARPLGWYDLVTGWTIPLATLTQLQRGQPITLHKWALQEFQLHLVGHRGSVPIQACNIPIGIKIPLELEVLATSLYPACKSVEKAFGIHVGVRITRNGQAAAAMEWLSPHGVLHIQVDAVVAPGLPLTAPPTWRCSVGLLAGS